MATSRLSLPLRSVVAHPRIRRFIKSAFWFFSGKLLGALSLLVVSVLSARLLEPAAMGVFLLILSVVPSLSKIGTVGSNYAAVRFIAEALHTGREGDVPTIIRHAMLMSGAMSVVLLVLIVGMPGPMIAGQLVDQDLVQMFVAFLALATVFASFRQLVYDSFRGFDEMRTGAWFDGAIMNGLAGLFLVLLWLGGAEVSLFLCLAAVTLAGAVAALAGLFVLRRRTRRLADLPSTRPPSPLEIIQVGSPQMATNFIVTSTQQAGLWVLTAVGSLVDVALLGIALRFTNVVSMLFIVSNQIFAPLIAGMNARGETKELGDIIQALNSLITMGCVIISLPLFIFPGEILSFIFGPEYANAGLALILLTAAQLVAVVCGPAQMVLTMTGNERFWLGITALMLGVQVALAVPLGILYGADGAAAATAVAMIGRALLANQLAVRRTGIRTLPLLAPRAILVTLRARPSAGRPTGGAG
jgi:O-antigen/teichoic acid export membrane protein